MAADNFEKAFNYTLIDEKGKYDDPDDRSLRKCDGITQGEYDGWLHVHRQQPADVWNIDAATLKVIYFVNYWSPWCERLPNAIDYLFYDMAVHSGFCNATLVLQRSLELSPKQIDGQIGIYTVARALTYPDMKKLVCALCTEHERVHDGSAARIAHELANATFMLENPPYESGQLGATG